MMSWRCCASATLCMLALVAWLATAVRAQENRADWVDPNDMLNFDPTSGEMRKRPTEKRENEPAGGVPVHGDPKQSSGGQPVDTLDATETSHNKTCDCSNHTAQLRACRQHVKELESVQMPISHPRASPDEGSEMQFFRQYVLSLLKQFDQDISLPTFTYVDSYEADIQISPSDIETLRKFGSGNRQGSVQDAHAILVAMVTRIRLPDNLQDNSRSTLGALFSVVKDNLPAIIQVCSLVVLLQMMLFLQMKLHLSWKMLLMQLLLLSFVLSVVWTWWHMYKVALANRHAVLDKDKPAECREGGSVTFWQTIVSAFTITTDPCAQYYEKLLVDPMWEISPTQAIAKTITKFVVEPLEHIAHAMNKFLKAILIGLPVTISPLVLGFVMVICLFLLMMCCGYQVRIWPLFSLEPTPRSTTSTSNEKQLQQQRIEDLSEQVHRLTIQQSAPKTRPAGSSRQPQGHISTELAHPEQGPPLNTTIITPREPRPTQQRSRRTKVRRLVADKSERMPLDAVPVNQPEDSLAGGDAVSSLTVEAEHTDNESDFEVIKNEGEEHVGVETLSSLHRQNDTTTEAGCHRNDCDTDDDASRQTTMSSI